MLQRRMPEQAAPLRLAKTSYGGTSRTVPDALNWAGRVLSASSALYFSGVQVVAVDDSTPPVELPELGLENAADLTADWAPAHDVRMKMRCGKLLSLTNAHRTAKQHFESCRRPECGGGGSKNSSGNKGNSSKGSSSKRPRLDVEDEDEEEDEPRPTAQQSLDRYIPNNAQKQKVG
jgi:hypothetical protein